MADQQHLWQSPAWLRLLHFDPARGNSKSRIDGGIFFLAPDGATNPVAEGEATLAGLVTPSAVTEQAASVQCCFPARTAFLTQALDPGQQSILPVSCPSLDRWLQSMAPAAVSLVFPVSYLNNPASLFGHTLLRIDSGAFSADHRLLSASIGYAASTGQDSKGLRYAFNGVFGGYTGGFSAQPYYVQVQEYGAIENRDIWEYPLALQTKDIDFMLRHVWELGQAEYDYYFFDENCSFQLLALLEAVYPQLQLTAEQPLWTIPVDTVRTVIRQMGTAGPVTYRPSRRSRLITAIADLDPASILLARDLARAETENEDDRFARLTGAQQAAVLDLAVEYLLYAQVEASGQENPTDTWLAHLLSQRSRIDQVSEDVQVPVPAIRPDQGHESSRWSLESGLSEDGPFFQFGFRPVLHDLFDPPGGYDPGAQLIFLAPTFRFLPDKEQLRLETFDLISIVSLPRRSALFTPVAWSASLSLEHQLFADGNENLAGLGQAAWGWRIGEDRLFGYTLIGGSLLVSNQCANAADIGPTVESGIHAAINDQWTVGLTGRTAYYLFDQHNWFSESHLVQSFAVDRNNSLRLDLSLNQTGDETSVQFLLGWHHFFRL